MATMIQAEFGTAAQDTVSDLRTLARDRRAARLEHDAAVEPCPLPALLDAIEHCPLVEPEHVTVTGARVTRPTE